MPDIIIRPEAPGDIGVIHALTAAAFDNRFQAEIVDNLRDDDALVLSQVAERDGQIVGHAGYSLVSVTDGDQVVYFPALGPISVWPARQRQGIGAALVRSGQTSLRQMGYGLLFLVGHVSYYPRFGFQPALPLGFTSDYVKDANRHEHFMLSLLDERALGEARGHVRFHPAFDED